MLRGADGFAYDHRIQYLFKPFTTVFYCKFKIDGAVINNIKKRNYIIDKDIQAVANVKENLSLNRKADDLNDLQCKLTTGFYVKCNTG